MPRCFPDVPVFRDGGRAERAVWDALREQLPDDALLFHGRRFQERRQEYEADLIVGVPGAGWAVIEVKGGDVRHQGGAWEQKQKGVWQRVDPVGQAQDCRHVLQRHLKRLGVSAARSPAVHLVAVPDRDVPQGFETADLPRSMLLARGDVATAYTRLLKALGDHAQGTGPFDPPQVEEFLAAVVGPSLPQADALALDAENEAHVAELTARQQQIAGFLRNQHRVAVVGGAGSGKTWLALEQTRLLAKQGQAVALVCYSRGLAHFLRRVTDSWPRKERPAYVGLFHDLPVRWGAPQGREDDSRWWEEELPRLLGELAAQRPVAERFDSIVVDEGQDFSASWWPPTLQALKDPDAGGLFVFLDEGQRIFDRHGKAPIELAPFPLDHNIRNTKRIAQVFGSLALEQQAYDGLEGPPVRFVQCSPGDAVSAADEQVERLTEHEGWPPGSVALLTTGHRHPVHKEIVDGYGWDAYWDEFFVGDDVFYGHVLGFKGLERPVVVLAVNGFRDRSRAREMLYVGLSRARTQLVVCGDLAEIAEIGGDGVRNRLQRAAAPA